LLAVGACLAALPAAAQSTKERLTRLEGQLARTERLLENNQAMQTELLQRLQELRSENQGLRERLDQLAFEATQSGDRQRQLYLDLDARLQALEAGGTAAGAAAAGADGEATGAAVSDADSYAAAFEQLKQADYAAAQEQFQAFLASYPDSELRGNAQYWLAETYYVTKDFATAKPEFQKVIADYPTSRKIPDAWLKLGFCNYELEQWADARVALSTVTSRYGDSTAARLAGQRLEQMRAAGH
jgi:tol-pal system protein YbgF